MLKRQSPLLDATQVALSQLQVQTTRALDSLAHAFGAGGLTPGEFGDRMAVQLEDAHAQAAMLGRHRAGDMAPLEADDVTFASAVVDAESEYLDAFVRDLECGKYTAENGLPDIARISARAALYAGRLRGTANETFTLASDEDLTFTWVLGGDEEHCEACPDLAQGSPYRAEELPTIPGANATPCLWNCRCSLVRSDGRTGFQPL